MNLFLCVIYECRKQFQFNTNVYQFHQLIYFMFVFVVIEFELFVFIRMIFIDWWQLQMRISNKSKKEVGLAQCYLYCRYINISNESLEIFFSIHLFNLIYLYMLFFSRQVFTRIRIPLLFIFSKRKSVIKWNICQAKTLFQFVRIQYIKYGGKRNNRKQEKNPIYLSVSIIDDRMLFTIRE